MDQELNREIIEQTIRGYEEVNRITEAERSDRLRQMSIGEAYEIFRSLYRVWEQFGGKLGGDLTKLDQHRVDEALELRRKMNRAAEIMMAG